MRVPDPIATTTTEAYLAYKAGFLRQDELKPKLYEPYLHLDAWLAYWCGLTASYPLNEQGSPECLTDEEAIIAYLSEVTDTFPRTAKDPSDSRMAAYLRHLADSSFDTPEEVLTNSEFYLYNMGSGTPSTVSGDTPITLESAAKYPIDELVAYGWVKRTVLPDDYTELESIEFTGTQYLITDVSLLDARRVSGDVSFADASPSAINYVVGVRSVGSGSKAIGFGLLNSSRGGFTIYDFQWEDNSIAYAVTADERISFDTTITTTNTLFKVNGVTKYSGAAASGATFVGDRTVTIGALQDTGTTPTFNYFLSGKVFGIKMYDGSDNLIFNGIPAKDSSNVLGLYDTVSDTFYTNEGTGDFVAGNVATPTPTAPTVLVCNNGILKANQQGQVYADGTPEILSLSYNGLTIGTAGVQMLLKNGTYTDTQDVISGEVNKIIQPLAFDGAEDWAASSTSGVYYLNIDGTLRPGSTPLSVSCTHFVGTALSNSLMPNNSIKQASYAGYTEGAAVFVKMTSAGSLAGFKQFLAEQAQAGTPVIVLTVLADAIATYVAPQELKCQSGNNVITSNKGKRALGITYHRL